MTGFFIGVLIGLLKHVEDLKKIKDIRQTTPDADMLFSILLNLGISWRGFVGFGRPYMPAIVYTISVLFVTMTNHMAAGSVVWTERLFAIFSLITVMGEVTKSQLEISSLHVELSFFYHFFLIEKRMSRTRKT